MSTFKAERESPRRATRLRRRVGETVMLAFVGVALAFPACLHAQDDDGWIGKRVVQKYREFELRRAGGVVDRKGIEFYRVKGVNGPELFVESEGRGIGGWVRAEHVVPVEQAIQFFTRYIRSHPRDAHGYAMRAMIWSKEKHEIDRALADDNKAIRLDPTQSAVYHNRGAVFFLKRDFDKAIADYTEAIRLDPASILSYEDRGTAWLALGEYDKAIADLNEAISIDPTHAPAYCYRGLVWWAKEDYDKAIADFDKAIMHNSYYVFALNQRGRFFYERKKYDSAIADYNKAIRLDPANNYAYFGLATIWATCPDAKFRDGKKAVEAATKVCVSSNWKDADDLECLAAAYAEDSDYEAAVAWQTKAIALHSDAEDKMDTEARLKLYRDRKPLRETDR